jgi:hypothetical protein
MADEDDACMAGRRAVRSRRPGPPASFPVTGTRYPVRSPPPAQGPRRVVPPAWHRLHRAPHLPENDLALHDEPV